MTELVKGLSERMCRECYELISPENDEWRDMYDSATCRGGLNKENAHALYNDENPYRSHSGHYSGELAEVLEALYQSGSQSEEIGEADTFGHYAMFDDIHAYMLTDSQGFVYAYAVTPWEYELHKEALHAAYLVWETESELS